MDLKNIAHLTSVHPRYDTRIFLKQCRSLANIGYNTNLVVADGFGYEKKDGVSIVDVGCMSGRLNRMFKTTKRVLEKAIEINADVYHIHDPELIPAGIKLRQMGKAVIFDSHEDIPKDILDKPYLGALSRRVLARGFSLFEKVTCSKFDAVVCATPSIGDKFNPINSSTWIINNYPLLGELNTTSSSQKKKNQVCYIGTIDGARGLFDNVRAFSYVKLGTTFALGGRFSSPDLLEKVRAESSWDRVNNLGLLNRENVRDVMAASIAGLVTFHPAANHVEAQPNKMFEYMSAGIPVIASDFPLWREIVEGNDCGICVNPFDAKAIAAAIDYLVANPKRAKEMGQNGQLAVLNRYNWSTEERKLFSLYEGIREFKTEGAQRIIKKEHKH